MDIIPIKFNYFFLFSLNYPQFLSPLPTNLLKVQRQLLILCSYTRIYSPWSSTNLTVSYTTSINSIHFTATSFRAFSFPLDFTATTFSGTFLLLSEAVSSRTLWPSSFVPHIIQSTSCEQQPTFRLEEKFHLQELLVLQLLISYMSYNGYTIH